MEWTHVTHTFEPVYDDTSKILILGSFPSVKSREQQFYYGHPQNRFWKVIAQICREEVPESPEEKQMLLKKHHIALWDVIESCDIMGSSDSSIRNVVPNDMDLILSAAEIRNIFVNGNKAYELFLKYCKRDGQPPLTKLPSTSPANAAWNMEKLLQAWKGALGGLIEA